MAEPWVVLKFGGTSVAGRSQWEAIARIVEERRAEGFRVLVVCSALAGVTDALVRMAATGSDGTAVDDVLDRHGQLADELGLDADALLTEGRARLAASAARVADPHPAHAAELISQGEWLSTRLGQAFLSERMEADWVDARDALTAIPEPDPDGRRAWLSARCEADYDAALVSAWSLRAPVLVTPGFLVASPDGRVALLGRGGSDTSAALLAGRLGARRAEIWTDVPGLYSADPRREPEARLLDRLAYDEALELAAGGARVIHGRSIRAAAGAGIPLLIRDLASPGAPGTLITADGGAAAEGIRAIACQRDMAVFLLENLDTRQQVGFLAGVFNAVAARGVSVDQVATSETTTTIAVSRETNHLDEGQLEALRAELASLCRVEMHADCVCVNLVGRGARTALGRLGPVREFFDDHPLLMLSQSANDLSISLLVRSGDADPLMRLVHRTLVAES